MNAPAQRWKYRGWRMQARLVGLARLRDGNDGARVFAEVRLGRCRRNTGRAARLHPGAGFLDRQAELRAIMRIEITDGVAYGNRQLELRLWRHVCCMEYVSQRMPLTHHALYGQRQLGAEIKGRSLIHIAYLLISHTLS